jgi:hypothetical protein
MLMNKNFNISQLKTKPFLYKKLQIIYPLSSMKGVQGTGEAFSTQSRTSNTLKHEIYSFFSI